MKRTYIPCLFSLLPFIFFSSRIIQPQKAVDYTSINTSLHEVIKEPQKINVALYSQTVNYSPSTDIIFNPERGLQKYSITASDYSTTPGANNLSVSTLTNWKNSNDKISVVFRYFLLEDFMNSNINTTYLNNIQQDFDNIRTAGLKVIIRFSYSDRQGTAPQQPSKSRILTHISQLAPILNANQDVIFSHQAGFIGTWGEWYYTNSPEFGTAGNISSSQWAARKDILDAMLIITPATIPIQVRYAGIKTQLYGNNQLTPQTAYQNTANARIGFFNDAFLNNWGDQGTYGVNSECKDPVGNSDYNYLSNETQYLPMTGETNGLNPCNNGFRTTGANAIQEMESTNWTTLNRDYHPDFWNQIISSNHYNEILKRLGYRFVLHSSTVKANGLDFDLSMNFSNEGFARVFKERDVYLVMKNIQNDSMTSYLLDTDIRTWENSFTINQKIRSASPGTFQLYLWMPDKEPSLTHNPDYSIQLANQNTWQVTTGYNDLMQRVSLQCSSSISIDTRTECERYIWIDGNTYTSNNNTASYTLKSANGCDSIIRLDLTIQNAFTTTDTRIECNSYTWIDSNTYTSNNHIATHTLTDKNGCDSIVTLDLTINKVSDITVSMSGNTLTANNSDASYQWLDCANGFSPIGGATNSTFTPSTNGEYAVQLTENGCRDTSSCVSMVVTDVNDLTLKEEVLIFPNPVKNRLFINHSKKIRGVIQILDSSGRVLIRESLNRSSESGSINLEQLSPGMYFVRILSNNNVTTKKLIKV